MFLGVFNIGLLSNNSMLSVVGVLGSYGGEYECVVINVYGCYVWCIIVCVVGKW